MIPVRQSGRSADILAECEAELEEILASRKVAAKQLWDDAGRSKARREAAYALLESEHEMVLRAQDLIATLKEKHEAYPPSRDYEVVLRSSRNDGFVYFLVREADRAVKIGYSNNPSRRVKEYQAGSGPAHLVGEMPGTLKDEKALHRRFKEHCVGGEWFAPTEELLDLIRQWPPF